MSKQNCLKDSIFRIGEIYAVNGREITIKVDKNKNLSHILYQGQLVKNVSVGSYLKIKKGFNRLVAKVEGELLKENHINEDYHSQEDRLFRFLIVKIIGYFDGSMYHKGIKEIPLIGDICYLLDNEEFALIHRFAAPDEIAINLGHIISDENIPVEISIDKLFASHVGIFGNTGSGKSHTLAKLYQELFAKMGQYKKFKETARFVLFDFNGEYSSNDVITPSKTIFNLSSMSGTKDKLPISLDDLIRLETLSILSDATEKTQQPFLKRTIRLYNRVTQHETYEEIENHFKNLIKKFIRDIILLKDVQRERYLLDLINQILINGLTEDWADKSVFDGIDLYNTGSIHIIGTKIFLDSDNYDENINRLVLSSMLEEYKIPNNPLERFVAFLYLRLIMDVVENRANNEHIAPVVRRLESFIADMPNVFDVSNDTDIFKGNNISIINLNDLKIELKKLIPLMISMSLYRKHKVKTKGSLRFLNIIIDEAHNILSTQSKRETESWKDYRLETYEEIIKEGRKFGVFLTISSQRPSDISPTIVSQLHNYLIHRLVNNRDVEMIEKAVAYLDKISIESLPILPVGACILSGQIADLPIVMQVSQLPLSVQPKSQTIKLSENWVDDECNDEYEDDDYIDDADRDIDENL
ncbi:MAG: ATP-binding protein [Muribaculaceae bacterium]|uniref:ATP-binding protein n=1 Tax=Bacteroides acidifaciens TaxID=85831 RepID=UPI001A2861BC|nr:ATP-binding protein [Bacteroides acidifaciens]MBJ2190350.1 ATP-binding protein [Muribaculaceae bacterium]